jgi:tRNA-Thr(GGU) m(6)t(6)A37 methyltransferase TsaA
MSYPFDPIGIIRSPFTDKFGIPRQPGLVDAAEGSLRLLPPYDRDEAFAGLAGFTHVWLIFVFHADCLDAGWRPTVRPPRLGGRGKVGVFASRAPYRPNPIGLSAVRHLGLERDRDGLSLRLVGIDLLDGTPVLDVKPYVPYADRIDGAGDGFATGRPPLVEVRFSPSAERQISAADPTGQRRLRVLIEQVIAQDPRPGYMDRYPERRSFGLRLYDLDVSWELADDGFLVTAVAPVDDKTPRTWA